MPKPFIRIRVLRVQLCVTGKREYSRISAAVMSCGISNGPSPLQPIKLSSWKNTHFLTNSVPGEHLVLEADARGPASILPENLAVSSSSSLRVDPRSPPETR